MHVMFDLETLSLRVNAVIFDFGYCLFEPNQPGLILDSMAMVLNWSEQIERRSLQFRHVSGSTLKWWLQQDKAAQDKLTRAEKPASFTDMVREIKALPWANIDGVWSHGANFDLPIITEIFAELGEEVPWHYRATRDTRTIFWLAGMVEKDLERAEVKHSAMHDAIAQAKSVQKAIDIIRVTGVQDVK